MAYFPPINKFSIFFFFIFHFSFIHLSWVIQCLWRRPISRDWELWPHHSLLPTPTSSCFLLVQVRFLKKIPFSFLLQTANWDFNLDFQISYSFHDSSCPLETSLSSGTIISFKLRCVTSPNFLRKMLCFSKKNLLSHFF